MKHYKFLVPVIICLILFSCSGDGKKDTKEPMKKINFSEWPKKKPQKKVAKNPKTKIVCDTFNLVTKMDANILHLAVDTDLPDNTVVMVSVDRSYLEKGNLTKYSIDYFSEKSKIGKWRTKNKIMIDNLKWKSELKTKQEELSRLGAGFSVASISNKIRVSMVVPINQPDSNFGERNYNLIGKAVNTKGLRIVEDEIEINYPLESSAIADTNIPSLNPMMLDLNQTYIVSRQTPLMPSLTADNHFESFNQVKQIPKGGGFKVIKTVKIKNKPWYRVTAFNMDKIKIGTGWINSTALLGQKLEACK